MVCLAVRTIDCRPVVCNARPALFKAHAAVERGSWIEAGCYLREGIKLFLLADCEWHGAVVSKRKARQTPRALLQALRDAGGCDDFCGGSIEEAIDIGNRAAHCQFVQPVELTDAITTMHFILDNCAKYLVAPVAEGRLS